MWKWHLIRDTNLNVSFLLIFFTTGIVLIYGVDAIYKRIKKKNK